MLLPVPFFVNYNKDFVKNLKRKCQGSLKLNRERRSDLTMPIGSIGSIGSILL